MNLRVPWSSEEIHLSCLSQSTHGISLWQRTLAKTFFYWFCLGSARMAGMTGMMSFSIYMSFHDRGILGQHSKWEYTSAYQASDCIFFDDVQLNTANYMAEPCEWASEPNQCGRGIHKGVDTVIVWFTGSQHWNNLPQKPRLEVGFKNEMPSRYPSTVLSRLWAMRAWSSRQRSRLRYNGWSHQHFHRCY